jgi:hypothetical protein
MKRKDLNLVYQLDDDHNHHLKLSTSFSAFVQWFVCVKLIVPEIFYSADELVSMESKKFVRMAQKQLLIAMIK